MDTEAMTAVESLRSPLPNGRAVRDPDARDGIVGSTVALSMGMVESGVRASAKIIRGTTNEAQRLIEASLGLGEQLVQTAFRNARTINTIAFQLANEAVERSEQAALLVLGHGQVATDRVAELAAHATQVVVGARGNGTRASA